MVDKKILVISVIGLVIIGYLYFSGGLQGTSYGRGGAGYTAPSGIAPIGGGGGGGGKGGADWGSMLLPYALGGGGLLGGGILAQKGIGWWRNRKKGPQVVVRIWDADRRHQLQEMPQGRIPVRIRERLSLLKNKIAILCAIHPFKIEEDEIILIEIGLQDTGDRALRPDEIEITKPRHKAPLWSTDRTITADGVYAYKVPAKRGFYEICAKHGGKDTKSYILLTEKEEAPTAGGQETGVAAGAGAAAGEEGPFLLVRIGGIDEPVTARLRVGAETIKGTQSTEGGILTIRTYLADRHDRGIPEEYSIKLKDRQKKLFRKKFTPEEHEGEYFYNTITKKGENSYRITAKYRKLKFKCEIKITAGKEGREEKAAEEEVTRPLAEDTLLKKTERIKKVTSTGGVLPESLIKHKEKVKKTEKPPQAKPAKPLLTRLIGKITTPATGKLRERANKADKIIKSIKKALYDKDKTAKFEESLNKANSFIAAAESAQDIGDKKNYLTYLNNAEKKLSELERQIKKFGKLTVKFEPMCHEKDGRYFAQVDTKTKTGEIFVNMDVLIGEEGGRFLSRDDFQVEIAKGWGGAPWTVPVTSGHSFSLPIDKGTKRYFLETKGVGIENIKITGCTLKELVEKKIGLFVFSLHKKDKLSDMLAAASTENMKEYAGKAGEKIAYRAYTEKLEGYIIKLKEDGKEIDEKKDATALKGEITTEGTKTYTAELLDNHGNLAAGRTIKITASETGGLIKKQELRRKPVPGPAIGAHISTIPPDKNFPFEVKLITREKPLEKISKHKYNIRQDALRVRIDIPKEYAKLAKKSTYRLFNKYVKTPEFSVLYDESGCPIIDLDTPDTPGFSNFNLKLAPGENKLTIKIPKKYFGTFEKQIIIVGDWQEKESKEEAEQKKEHTDKLPFTVHLVSKNTRAHIEKGKNGYETKAGDRVWAIVTNVKALKTDKVKFSVQKEKDTSSLEDDILARLMKRYKDGIPLSAIQKDSYLIALSGQAAVSLWDKSLTEKLVIPINIGEGKNRIEIELGGHKKEITIIGAGIKKKQEEETITLEKKDLPSFKIEVAPQEKPHTVLPEKNGVLVSDTGNIIVRIIALDKETHKEKITLSVGDAKQKGDRFSHDGIKAYKYSIRKSETKIKVEVGKDTQELTVAFP